MQTFLTCAVLAAPEPHAWGSGPAARLQVPAGMTVRRHPHLPGVCYAEGSVVAAGADVALELAARAASAAVAGLGFPVAVDELVVVGPDGVTCWLAETVGAPRSA